MAEFIIATHNAKKLEEMRRILKPLGVNAVTDKDIGIELQDVEETGLTFEENAFIKANSGCLQTGLPCIADDSGLCVDSLGGEPGIYSARYSGEHGNDEKNIEKLLNRLNDVEDDRRTAHFVCAICVCFPDGKTFTVTGRCNGSIGHQKRGNGGFGYDPIFMVGDKSFAELSKQEKDKISHRGNALRELMKILPEYL